MNTIKTYLMIFCVKLFNVKSYPDNFKNDIINYMLDNLYFIPVTKTETPVFIFKSSFSIAELTDTIKNDLSTKFSFLNIEQEINIIIFEVDKNKTNYDKIIMNELLSSIPSLP